MLIVQDFTNCLRFMLARYQRAFISGCRQGICWLGILLDPPTNCETKSFVGVVFEPLLIERMYDNRCGFEATKQQFERLLQLGEKLQGVMSLVSAYLSAFLL